MSFHFRDGMWLTQEPPCRLMIWTWFHLFIKDDGLRILPGMYNHIVIAVHFQKSTVCVCIVCVCVPPLVGVWHVVRPFFLFPYPFRVCLFRLGMLVLCFLPFFPSSFAFPVSCPGQVSLSYHCSKVTFPNLPPAQGYTSPSRKPVLLPIDHNYTVGGYICIHMYRLPVFYFILFYLIWCQNSSII